MKTKNFIQSIAVILTLTVGTSFPSFCQSCSGHWVTNRPLTYQCISGQHIGSNNLYLDPPDCPTNPVYAATQTNTFIFNNPINDFFIDFNALDCTSPGCPRMQIKINGIQYPLAASNLVELPLGTMCSGSLSFLNITPDGYITTLVSQSNGQGRLVFSGVNASSITFSTNDRAGIIVASPCFEPLPIEIQSFSGKATGDCKILLAFESGIESNVRNIEVQGSLDGMIFSTIQSLAPRGSDSRYSVSFRNFGDIYFRVKVNDLDGHFTYSELIRIDDNCTPSDIKLFPNPSAEKLLVENVQRYDQLTILDLSGRKILSQQVTNSFTELNIQSMLPGFYFLDVFRRNVKIKTIKFLKK